MFFTFKLLLCREKKPIYWKVAFQNYSFFFSPSALNFILKQRSSCSHVVFSASSLQCGGIQRGIPVPAGSGSWRGEEVTCAACLAPAGGLSWDLGVMSLSSSSPSSAPSAESPRWWGSTGRHPERAGHPSPGHRGTPGSWDRPSL